MASSMQLTTQQRKVTIPPPSLDVQPSQASRDTGNNNSLGPPEPGERAERNESSLHQLDSSRETNTTRSFAQQIDRTASVRTSAEPFTSPPSNRPSASTTSPPPPLPAPALTETTSGRVHATRSMPTDESQARSGRVPLELPHHRGDERGKTVPDEQSRTSHSATPSRLPSPPVEHAAAATEPFSQSLPVSSPRSLDKSVSRREAKRATDGPASDKKEKKGVSAPEEYETRAEDSTTSSDGAKRHEVRLIPPTSTPPPPSVPTPSQPKHATRAPSNSDAIVSRVEQKPHPARSPSVADSQIKSTSPSESPSFLTALRSTSDFLLLSPSQVSPTVAGSLINKGGPGPSGVKQIINNEGKLQLGGLNRGYFP